jgi:hypothetical protein
MGVPIWEEVSFQRLISFTLEFATQQNLFLYYLCSYRHSLLNL